MKLFKCVIELRKEKRRPCYSHLLMGRDGEGSSPLSPNFRLFNLKFLDRFHLRGVFCVASSLFC